MLNPGWDLKNYFGMLGSWLKQFSSVTDADMFKMMSNPWQMWNPSAGTTTQGNAQQKEPRPSATARKSKKADA
jgi:hypothetical protein